MTGIGEVEVRLDEACRRAWTGMFATEVNRENPRLALDGCVALVELSGAWNGSLIAAVSERAGIEAATVVFGPEADGVDAADALAEWLNIVAGAIRVELGSEMSLPTVVPGGITPPTQPLARVDYAVPGGTLSAWLT